MILHEIRLSDFRCFCGESCVRFSQDPEKNVTIIYAENGVGKTTLLNALLWCLYGETTARFEKREEIINNSAKKEGRNKAWVEVEFEHNQGRYVARRYAGIIERDRRSFVVVRINDDGIIESDIGTPDTFVNTVIPREMASHFFFDGEHAEVFLGEANRNSIRSAVRDILGCSMVQTAIADLKDVSSHFRKKIPNTSATKSIAQLNRQLDDLATQTAQAQATVEKLKKDRAQTEGQVADIDTKLRETVAAKDLQKQRDLLNSRLQRAGKRKAEWSDEVRCWLGRDGRFIVSANITDETFSFLDDSEQKGRIPSPYNEEFVEDILAAELCICGSPLPPDSPERSKVASLLEKAANQIVRDRIRKIQVRLRNLSDGRKSAPSRLSIAQKHLADANFEFDSAEGELAEISGKLKGIKLEDIAAREQRREDLRGELQAIDRQIGALMMNIENTDREEKRLNAEIDEVAKLDKETAIFGLRRHLCDSIRNELEAQLTEEENRARSILRASIRRVLEGTTHKVLNPRMTDDYVISLVDSDGSILPKSSGENQLLGLAFTAALIEFAKVRQNDRDYRLLPGTIAPLVLDSPFGQLDNNYRATTAAFIPTMAQQVVLLVSSSQESEDVLNALGPRLGAEYVLVRHNSEPAGARKQESRYFEGTEYATAVFESQYDGTEVVEVRGP